MATPTYSEVITQINTFIVTNHNNEITAAVLNPILILLTDFTNNTIGDLNTLTTDENDTIVAAINSLKESINNITNNGVQLYTGMGDPNVTPPPTYKPADFYLEVDFDSLPVQLWQFNAFEWVLSGGGSSVWGGITGNIDDQIDLKIKLDEKVSNIIAGENISVNSFNPQNPIISAIPSTSAGIFDRVYFTGQVSTVATPVGPNYDTIRNGKGSVASVTLISPPIAASSKVFFTNDMIGPAQVVAGSLPMGNFTSFLSVLPSAIAALKRFTIEIFLCDNAGVIIPQAGPPSTDPSVFYAGKNTVVILDSGNLTLPTSNTSVGLSGYLNTPLNVAVGQRFRYHISVERGAGGGSQTININIGNTWNSYIEAPVPLTTSTVINVSGVTGATATDALNALNTGKVNGSGTTNTLPIFTAPNTVGNSFISQSGNSVGVNGVFVNDNIGDPKHVFNITNDTGGVPQYLFQATAYSNTTGEANVHIRKARGTATAPLAVQSGDLITSWGCRGYATNKFASSSVAMIANAEENFTDTANGTSLTFSTTPIGTFDSRVDALKLEASGNARFFKDILIDGAVNSPLSVKGVSPYIRWLNDSDVRQAYIQHNGTDLIISTDIGGIILGDLVGVGNRQVVADATGKLSATDAAPTSGTYTPTTSGLINCTVSSALGSYTKVGNIVTVNISFVVSATVSAASTRISFSLPVNTVLTSGQVGVGAAKNNAETAYISTWGILQASNTMQMSFISSGTGNHNGNIIFQYSTI